MRHSFFLLMMLSFSSYLYAQIDSTIYGIVKVPTGKYFSKINPQTGSVTNLSGLLPYTTGFTGRTIDPRTHTFYLLQDSVLLKISLSTGQLVEAIPVVNYPNTHFVGIAYNCYDTTLYGLCISTVAPSIYFATIDGNTGTVEFVSDSIAPSYRSFTSTTIDPINNIFYFETTGNKLVGVDLYSGSVVSSVPINLPQDHYFGPLTFNCIDHKLYGLSGSSTTGRKFARIDPQSGSITNISSDTIAHSILVNPATIDPYKSIYYFIAGDWTFRGVGIYDGELKVNSPISLPVPDPDSYFSNFFYNHECYHDYQVNINEYPSEGIVIFPNPANESLFVKTKSDAEIQVIDLLGRTVIRQNVKYSSIINIKKLPEGTYLISVSTKTSSFYKKLTIHHN
jgi:hypothetical protein